MGQVVTDGRLPANTGGYAKRVGVIIDPEGKVIHYNPSVSAGDFPNLALGMVG